MNGERDGNEQKRVLHEAAAGSEAREGVEERGGNTSPTGWFDQLFQKIQHGRSVKEETARHVKSAEHPRAEHEVLKGGLRRGQDSQRVSECHQAKIRRPPLCLLAVS